MSNAPTAENPPVTVLLVDDQLLIGDCVQQMAQLDAGSVDLVFADPPFNIGYEYDVYHDRRAKDDYLAWAETWLASGPVANSEASNSVRRYLIRSPLHVEAFPGGHACHRAVRALLRALPWRRRPC